MSKRALLQAALIGILLVVVGILVYLRLADGLLYRRAMRALADPATQATAESRTEALRRAISDLERVTRLRDANPDAQWLLSTALVELADYEGRSGDSEQALQLLNRAINAFPMNTSAYLSMGRLAERSGRLALADNAYRLGMAASLGVTGWDIDRLRVSHPIPIDSPSEFAERRALVLSKRGKDGQAQAVLRETLKIPELSSEERKRLRALMDSLGEPAEKSNRGGTERLGATRAPRS